MRAREKTLLVAAVLGWTMCFLIFSHHGNQAGGSSSPILATSESVILARSSPGVQLRPSPPPENRVFLLSKLTERYSNPVPGLSVLESMSDAEIENFFHVYIMSFQITCNRVERMGKAHDGGWDFCLESRFSFDNKSCLVYSFGINRDFSFDDAMAAMGCEVHSFDPSMYNFTDHLRGQRVHFHRIGLGSKNEVWAVTEKRRQPWKIATLASIRKRLGHSIQKRRLDVLKMDIESAEIEALPIAIQDGVLDDVRQLSLEMHTNGKRDNFIKFLNILRNLYSVGFRLYLTSRNFRCEYKSRSTRRHRIKCNEAYFVNVKNQNVPFYRAEWIS